MIHVESLTKRFVSKQAGTGLMGAFAGLFHRKTVETVAVDNMSFDIGEGEMVGYIGPNGAGKSTTIKILTGILKASSGTVRVDGHDPFADRRRYVRKIGVVFGQRTQLWWDLAVVESFNLLSRIYDIPKATYKTKIGELTELLGLSEFLETPVRKLSLGQRMRCDLAASLLHEPKILFLDEPTIGLDVLGKARIREFLADLGQRNKVTVLLTTHDLEEMERLCQRIILIDHGRKLYDGAVDGLVDRYAPQRRIKAEFERPVEAAQFSRFGEQGIQVTLADSYHGEFVYDRRTATSAAVIQQLMDLATVRDLRIEEPGIEDVIHAMEDRGEFKTTKEDAA